jgi:hypothetical protein
MDDISHLYHGTFRCDIDDISLLYHVTF